MYYSKLHLKWINKYLKIFTWQTVNISGSVIDWIFPIVMAPDENAIAKETNLSCHAMWETGTENMYRF